MKLVEEVIKYSKTENGCCGANFKAKSNSFRRVWALFIVREHIFHQLLSEILQRKGVILGSLCIVSSQEAHLLLSCTNFGAHFIPHITVKIIEIARQLLIPNIIRSKLSE